MLPFSKVDQFVWDEYAVHSMQLAHQLLCSSCFAAYILLLETSINDSGLKGAVTNH